MKLKLTGDLFVMKMKNDSKFEKKWIFPFKVNIRNRRILTRALKNLKNLHFNELLLTKVYNVRTKKNIQELCLMALKIDVNFEGKLTCTF